MRKDTLEAIAECRIITIIRGVPKKNIVTLARALCDGGINCMELAFDLTGNVSDRETADMIYSIRDALGTSACVGAGTVTDLKKLSLAHDAGAFFSVSPDVNTAVISHTRELEMVSVPGALTPTEVLTAKNTGADIIKLFPVTIFGPDYIKMLRGPFPNIPFMAVGGIEANDIQSYLGAGAYVVGIGGALTRGASGDEVDIKSISSYASWCREKVINSI